VVPVSAAEVQFLITTLVQVVENALLPVTVPFNHV
jgi:hypothetical protein